MMLMKPSNFEKVLRIKKKKKSTKTKAGMIKKKDKENAQKELAFTVPYASPPFLRASFK